MSDLTDLSSMVRPWYRGPLPGVGEHLYADCPQLAAEGGPREGIGLIDPYAGGVCVDCFARHDPAEAARRRAVACEH